MECPNYPQLFDENDITVLSILSTLSELCLFYRTFHKYVSMLLCLFGLLANCTHIWILRRPSMLRSSVHTVLICIALADIGTMSSYAVKHFNEEFRQRLISLLIALVIFALCIPTLLAHDILPQENNSYLIKSTTLPTNFSIPDPNLVTDKYTIGLSKMFVSNDCFLLKLNLWLTGIMMKVAPCMLLLCLTYCLLIKLAKNKKKRMALLRDRAKEKSYNDRTTYMLLLMVSIFLCTELPQGIIAIFNAIYTAQFHLYIYLTIADVLDVLSLINCYVGFTVYFCTCSRYRRTFYSVFFRFR
uniref:G_PROTEIN_RECEP_F1_2 domain-containing protein n=1 Tax=Onchocerca volvulus TaxID=6282 RepID=A0A8R1XNE8_ONCVO